MTITELNNIININDIVIFDDVSVLPENDDFCIVNEEGIEYHIVYYYVGEYELIDNTYIHHYNSNKNYINTYQVTLDNEDKELLQLMCTNYKDIY